MTKIQQIHQKHMKIIQNLLRSIKHQQNQRTFQKYKTTYKFIIIHAHCSQYDQHLANSLTLHGIHSKSTLIIDISSKSLFFFKHIKLHTNYHNPCTFVKNMYMTRTELQNLRRWTSMLRLPLPGWSPLAPEASFKWRGKLGRVGFTRRAK